MTSIVVTGASSGIGRATALRLAGSGHHVFATVRKDADAESLAGHDRITPVFLDVTNPGQIAEAAAAIQAQVGDAGLDGLVNNAGSGTAQPIELMSPEALRRQLEVNTIGQLAVTQAFLPLLRRGHGRIVMIGSIGVRCTPPFSGPIVIPKAALTALTHALRQELAGSGVRTILVDPATIRTDAGDKFAVDAAATLGAFSPTDRAHYGAAFTRMTAAFASSHQRGSPPEAVAAVISRALTAKRPRSHYTVGKNSRRMTVVAYLPIRLADAVRRRIFGLAAASPPDAQDVQAAGTTHSRRRTPPAPAAASPAAPAAASTAARNR